MVRDDLKFGKMSNRKWYNIIGTTYFVQMISYVIAQAPILKRGIPS